jgi:hypothetical protein
MNQLGGAFRRADGKTYLHNQSERPVGLATARLALNSLCKCYCAISRNKVFLAGNDSQPGPDIERALYISHEMWHNYSRIATRGPGVSLLLRMPSDLPTPTFYPELPEDGSEASTGNVGVYLCASSFHTYELGQKRPSKMPRDWIGKKPKPGPLESVRCSHALKIKKRKKSWLDVTAIASATVPPLGRPTKALHPSRQQNRVVT